MPEGLSEKLRRELRDLKLVGDADIDTSDIPEVENWDRALRGRWAARNYEVLGFDIRGIANEILKRAWNAGASPTNMWLNKVTWFVYENALLNLGKLLTSARVEAWDHGPVFREIYGPSKVYRDEPIGALLKAFSKETQSFEDAIMPSDESVEKIIDDAISKFASKTSSQLRAISHLEGSPWYHVWYSPQTNSAGMVISPDVIFAAYDRR